MLKARRLFITGDINDDSAKVLVQQMLYMEAADPKAPVTLFINSGGGLVHSGLAILDVIASVSMPVHTVGYGRCFSIAAVLLAAGAAGHRRVYGNARLMIHEPSCSYPKLQASDIIIKADELRNTQVTLESILSGFTGKSQEEVSKATMRDKYMSAAEAQAFGIVDVVVPAKPRGLVVVAAEAEGEAAEGPLLPSGTTTPSVAAPASVAIAPPPAAAQPLAPEFSTAPAL